MKITGESSFRRMLSVRFLSFVLVLMTMPVPDSSAKRQIPDDDGHVLAREWKEYREALEKDLPQSQAEILEKIMDKAESRRYSWDFYDAVRKYHSAARSRDWKSAGTLAEDLKSRVETFGSPVVSWNFAEVWPLYTDRADIRDISEMKELRNENNAGFYRQDRYIGNGRIPEAVMENISNDYEYLLWSAFMYGYYSAPYGSGRDTLFTVPAGILKEYYGGRYPETAYIEYMEVSSIPEDSTAKRTAALEAFAGRYSGRAVRLFAVQELLRMKFDALSDSSATSGDYLALRRECVAFEKTRKSMKDEAALTESLTYPADMVKRLDFKQISAEVVSGTDTLLLSLRNLPGAAVQVQTLDSTTVFSRNVENPVQSYYVFDTLRLVLPVLDDGEYRIVCRSGDTEASFRYRRYTISMAWQIQDRGLAVYLADFKTGKPVTEADMEIYYRDSLVSMLPEMKFDGFTLVEADFPEKDGGYYIRCRAKGPDGTVRMTEKDYVWMSGNRPAYDTGRGLSGILLKNRAAFRPGDTLEFKTILFNTPRHGASCREDDGYRVWTGGKPVVAELLDASGNTVTMDTLSLNGFGSAAGRFILPEDRINGRFTLAVRVDGMAVASDVVRVDEFELPAFTAAFDPQDRIYFPGDTVTVTGRLKSYAGMSLAAADISYTVSSDGKVRKEGRLEPAADGSFRLSFIVGDGSMERCHYGIEVRVTDGTGETHRFSDWVAVDGFYFRAEIENDAEASVELPAGRALDDEAGSAGIYGVRALDGDFAVVSFVLNNADGDPVDDAEVGYALSLKGETVTSGIAVSGEKLWIDLSSWPSGTFRLSASVKVRGREQTCVYDLIRTGAEDTSLDKPFENFFKVSDSDDIALQFGASDGPVWAVVQLFGGSGTCLYSDLVHLDGVCGEPGSLTTLRYPFKDEYPDAVRMDVTYFRNGRIYGYSRNFVRRAEELVLPLSFSRFTDKSVPGRECVYELRTLPGAECAVSVFDVTTETVYPNVWRRVEPYFTFPDIRSAYANGRKDGRGGSARYSGKFYGYREEAVPFQLAGPEPRFALLNTADRLSSETGSMSKSAVNADVAAPEVTVREDFSEVLAFYPQLLSDNAGTVRFSFTAGDRLSSYYVSVFAHDRKMNNNALRREMQVSLPVTVSVMQPRYLYAGDRYEMQAHLSNVSEKNVGGTLSMYLYGCGDYETASPLLVMNRPAKVTSGSAVSEIFSIDVPEGVDTLGILTVFQAGNGERGESSEQAFSDAVFVTIPVSAPEQTLRESHSALFRPGMSRDSLYSVLRSEFVNVSGYGAVSEEISIRDMLKDAVPEMVGNDAPDALSAVRTYAASCLACRLRGELSDSASDGCGKLAEKLLSYQNAGGGFAWLKGGKSSPVITAVVLEYAAVLRDKGLLCPETASAMEKAVGYLDRTYFEDDASSTWGGTSLQQYLYVRSLYSSVPVAAGPSHKELKAFAKAARKYLYDRGQDAPGYILYKARRAMTALRFISGAGQNEGFLNSTGLKAGKRLASALDRYMASLKEYAVDHRSGGKYYPNAVLPFRGLLENELYAHSVLCRLLDEYGNLAGDAGASAIADGIRLWIMVQKETQDWDDDPAYLLALDAVLEGSAELLDTKVLILAQKYRKPFSEIRASGNDMTLKCRYFREDAAADGKDARYPGFREIADGEVMQVGDRIMAVYELWSAENRSFVRLSAPRYASLRPENQLSGYYGVMPRSLNSWSPYSYREVKSDRSIWYIDVLPEEHTSVTEILTVVQAGIFSSPAPSVECLYAPHYRANPDALPELESGK